MTAKGLHRRVSGCYQPNVRMAGGAWTKLNVTHVRELPQNLSYTFQLLRCPLVSAGLDPTFLVGESSEETSLNPHVRLAVDTWCLACKLVFQEWRGSFHVLTYRTLNDGPEVTI